MSHIVAWCQSITFLKIQCESLLKVKKNICKIPPHVVQPLWIAQWGPQVSSPLQIVQRLRPNGLDIWKWCHSLLELCIQGFWVLEATLWPHPSRTQTSVHDLKTAQLFFSIVLEKAMGYDARRSSDSLKSSNVCTLMRNYWNHVNIPSIF